LELLLDFFCALG